MFFLASFIAAFVPMMSYMVLLWVMDKYEREPVTAIIMYFSWGAFGAIILSIAGSFLLQLLFVNFLNDSSVLDFNSKVIFAPFVEEFMKGIFLLMTFSNKRFDNITDGLVYGGAIGLGFGMTENFLYFIGFGTTASAWFQLVVIRSVFSAVLHCIATASFGAFLGIAKFRSGNKILFILGGYFTAVLMHASWNFLVLNSETSVFGLLMMVILILVFFRIFNYSTKHELEIIRTELAEESLAGLIPEGFVRNLGNGKIFKFMYKMKSNDRIYVNNLVKLAFRKSQSKTCSANQKDFFEKEIQHYRNLISRF